MHMASPVGLVWHRNILKGRKSSIFVTYARALQTVHQKKALQTSLGRIGSYFRRVCSQEFLFPYIIFLISSLINPAEVSLKA